MDLGATVCTPRSPRCVICPLMTGCRGAQARHRRGAAAARAQGRQADAARARLRAGAQGRRHPAAQAAGQGAAGRHGRGAVERRGARASSSAAQALAEAPVPARWKMLDGLVRHTFTHFHLELTVARATATTDRPGQAGARHELVHGRPHDRAGAAHGDAQGDRARGEELEES